MIDTVPNDEIQSLLSNPEFHIVDNLGTYYAAFNCKSPLFDGKTPEQAACMREAFSLLIDRDYIVENAVSYTHLDVYKRQILYHVAGPTMPSAVRSKIDWNARTEASVSAPNTPSTVSFGMAG